MARRDPTGVAPDDVNSGGNAGNAVGVGNTVGGVSVDGGAAANSTTPDITADGGTAVPDACGGTGNGGGSWGTKCEAFHDDFGGAGRIEVMLDDGTSLIFGHAPDSYVQPGDRVEPGMVVGTMGTGNAADHVHIERRIWRDDLGTYWLIDPETGL